MKKVIIGLICFTIIAILGFTYYYYIAFKKKEIKVSSTNYIANIVENAINTIQQTNIKIENVVENLEVEEKQKTEDTEQNNNKSENTNKENNSNNEETNNNRDNTTTSNNQNYIGEEESRDETSNTSNEEKALKLAKEKWGEDISVYFTVANKNGNTYNISVNSSETTQVLAWYSVNIETGEVEEI